MDTPDIFRERETFSEPNSSTAAEIASGNETRRKRYALKRTERFIRCRARREVRGFAVYFLPLLPDNQRPERQRAAQGTKLRRAYQCTYVRPTASFYSFRPKKRKKSAYLGYFAYVREEDVRQFVAKCECVANAYKKENEHVLVTLVPY